MARKRKLNKRVVVLLVSFGVLAGLAVAAGIVYMLPKDPGALADRGDKMAKDGNYKGAVLAFREAVEEKGGRGNAEYWLKLGDYLLKWRNKDKSLGQAKRMALFAEARQAFLEAIRYDPKFLEAHRRATEIASVLARHAPEGDWVAYIRRLDALLEVDGSPYYEALDPIALLWPGRGYPLFSGKEKKEKEKEKVNPLFRRAQAEAKLAESRPEYTDRAIEDFDALIRAAPKEELYRLALARFHMVRGREKLAEKVYVNALKAIPDSGKARVYYSQLLQKDPKRKKEALALLMDAVKRRSTEPQAYLALSSYYRREKDADKAVNTLRRGIEAVPGDHRAYVILGRILAYQKEFAEVRQLLRKGLAEVAKAYPKDPKSEPTPGELQWHTIGMLELNHGLCDALMDEVHDRGEKDKILPKLGEALKRLQELEAAANAMRPLRGMEALGNATPFVIKIRGRIALVNGDLVEAEQLLRAAYEGYRGFEPKTAQLLINLYRRLGQLGEAEKIIQRFLSYTRDSPSALLALVELNIDYRRYAQAQRILDQVLKKDLKNKEARDLKALLDVVTNRVKGIPPSLERLDTHKARVLRLHASRLWLEGHRAGAIQLATDILKKSPKDLRAVIMLFRWYGQNQQPDKAQALLTSAMDVFRDHPASLQQLAMVAEPDKDKRLAYRLDLAKREKDPVRRAIQMADAYYRAGDAKNYEKLLQQAHAKAPADPMVIERLFVLALSRKDRETADKYAKAATDADLDKVQGRMYLARVARAFGDWDQAVRLTREAIDLRPRFSQAYAFLGDCYLADGKTEPARDAYTKAYDQNPSSVRALLGLVAVSERTGQAGEYGHWVDLAYKFRPDHPDIRERYLQRRQATEDPDKMIVTRLQVFRDNPRHLVNAGHLAALYERIGRLDQAEALYRHMVKVSRGSVQTISVLVDLLRRTERDAEAQQMLEKHLEDSPDKVGAYLMWARYLERNGGREQLAQAETAHKKAIEIGPKDRRGYVHMAQFCARRRRWAEAVTFQRQYLDRFKDKAHPGSDRELISLLIEAEQFDEVHKRVAEAVAKNPKDVRMRAMQGLAYLRQGDYVKAKQVLDRCLAIDPGYAQALTYRAQVHLADGRMAQAQNDLKDATRRSNAPAGVTLDLARVYENMGDPGSAHDVLNGLLADRPGYEPALKAMVLLCQRHRRWAQLKVVLDEARKVYPRELFYVVAQAEMLLAQDQAPLAAQLLAAARKVLTQAAPISALQMQALVQAGKPDEALAVGKGFLSHREIGPQITAIAGRAYYLKREDAKARQHFVDALRAARIGRQLEFVVAEVRRAYGPSAAAANLVKWIDVRPDNWQIRLLTGNMLVSEGKHRAAEALLTEALKQDMADRGRFMVARQLGLAYYEMGDYQKSLVSYRKALELSPKDQIALNNLAWLLVTNLNQIDEAMKYAKRAWELEPYNAHSLDTYGVVLMAKGRHKEALEVLNRSADIKKLAANLLHLGMVYEKLGQKQLALREYRRGWKIAGNKRKDRDYKALYEALKRLGEEPKLAGRND